MTTNNARGNAFPRTGWRQWLVAGLVAVAASPLWLDAAHAFDAPRDPVTPVSPDIRPYRKLADAKGTIEVSGSEIMADPGGMMSAWSAAFEKIHPQAKVVVKRTTGQERRGTVGSLGGGTSEIQQGFSVEPFTRKYGYDPVLVPVSFGHFYDQEPGIWVNADNPVSKLTLAQLEAIYSARAQRGQGPVRTWGDLGATGEWADKPVHPYGRSIENQVPWWFRERVLLGSMFSPNVVVPGNGKSPPIRDALIEDRYGIGYLSFNEGSKSDRIKALAIADADAGPYVQGTPASLASGAYPLIREYTLCINQRPGAPMDALAKEFLNFILSAEGQQAVSNAKAIPLSPRVWAQARQMVGLPP